MSGVSGVQRGQRQISNEEREKIGEFFRGYPEVAAVYLFGSYGTEFQLPSSDMDLGIVFTHPTELRDELEIDAELSLCLHTDKVDFVNLARAPLGLQHRALKEGELLCENNELAHSNFIEKVLQKYEDYRIRQKKFMQEYHASLKEAYGDG